MKMTTKAFWTSERIGLGLTLGGLLASASVAYGVITTRQEDHEKRITAVEQAPFDIAAIKASQVSMERDIEAIRQDQRVIMQAVTK